MSCMHACMYRDQLYNYCISIHAGGHLGRDKTYDKISARFYWKFLWKQVTNYVKSCPVCQTTNDAKFIKHNAPLHPIPVKPKVWRQVSIIIYTMKNSVLNL